MLSRYGREVLGCTHTKQESLTNCLACSVNMFAIHARSYPAFFRGRWTQISHVLIWDAKGNERFFEKKKKKKKKRPVTPTSFLCIFLGLGDKLKNRWVRLKVAFFSIAPVYESGQRESSQHKEMKNISFLLSPSLLPETNLVRIIGFISSGSAVRLVPRRDRSHGDKMAAI